MSSNCHGRPSDVFPCRVEWAIFCFPFVFVGMLVWMKFAAPEVYLGLYGERGLLEVAQFSIYLSAAAVAFGTFLTLRKTEHLCLRWLQLALFLGLIFVALEEISWGQRLLEFKVPREFATMNAQGESTLHNLRILQNYRDWLGVSPLNLGYIAVGLYGGLGWLLLRRWQTRAGSPWFFVVPDWYCAPYFLAEALFFSVGEYFREGIEIGLVWLHWSEQESAEFLLALGFLIFAASNWRRARELVHGECDSRR